MLTEKSSVVVQNFRLAAGFSHLYRCASTDVLAATTTTTTIIDTTAEQENNSASDVLLHQAGLVIDLRSASERNEQQAQQWSRQMAQPAYEILQGQKENYVSSSTGRTIVRLDPLGPGPFMEYLERHWLKDTERVQLGFYKVFATDRLHSLRMNVLNRVGLLGLNEAILDTGRHDLCRALQALTVHFERQQRSPAVIHCVQGKDRTGLVIMLCQAMIGLDEDEIVHCYHVSDSQLKRRDSKKLPTAAWGKLDRRVFAAAPRSVMKETLNRIALRHGSVCPGYLDFIGFDASWRKRFLAVAPRTNSTKEPNSKL